jgi:hypothetical protein
LAIRVFLQTMVGCRREVRAQVDASQRVDAVEVLDPHRRLAEVPLGLLVVLVEVLLGVGAPNAARLVGLVVQDQDVLRATDLAAEHAAHDTRVALHEALALDLHAAEVLQLVPVLAKHREEPGGELAVELLRQVLMLLAFSASHRCWGWIRRCRGASPPPEA